MRFKLTRPDSWKPLDSSPLWASCWAAPLWCSCPCEQCKDHSRLDSTVLLYTPKLNVSWLLTHKWSDFSALLWVEESTKRQEQHSGWMKDNRLDCCTHVEEQLHLPRTASLPSALGDFSMISPSSWFSRALALGKGSSLSAVSLSLGPLWSTFQSHVEADSFVWWSWPCFLPLGASYITNLLPMCNRTSSKGLSTPEGSTMPLTSLTHLSLKPP